MSTRFAALVSWLAAGHLLAGGLFWLLLQVPESNVWMLTVSLLISVAIVLLVGLVEQAGVRAWPATEPFSRAVWPAIGRAWLVVFPIALVALIWAATGAAHTWLSAHAGEIDAWFIAKLGWTKTGSLHTTLHAILDFVRYGIGIALGVSLLASLARQGVAGLASIGWARRAFAWRFLLFVVAVLIAGFRLPWLGVYWRPASLPPTWVQPAFATVKLSLLFLVANVAWAFILVKAPRPPASASEAPAV